MEFAAELRDMMAEDVLKYVRHNFSVNLAS